MRSRFFVLSAAIFVALAMVGCTGSGAGSSGGGLTIGAVWARPAAAGADTAAYFGIESASNEADALISASSPDAAAVELHEATTDPNGMMGMHPIDRVDVAPGARVDLKPGGMHLMVLGLTRELAAGDKLELVLVFERGGTSTVEAEIRQD